MRRRPGVAMLNRGRRRARGLLPARPARRAGADRAPDRRGHYAGVRAAAGEPRRLDARRRGALRYRVGAVLRAQRGPGAPDAHLAAAAPPPRRGRHAARGSRPYVQLLNTSAWLVYAADVDPAISDPEFLAFVLAVGDRMARERCGGHGRGAVGRVVVRAQRRGMRRRSRRRRRARHGPMRPRTSRWPMRSNGCAACITPSCVRPPQRRRCGPFRRPACWYRPSSKRSRRGSPDNGSGSRRRWSPAIAPPGGGAIPLSFATWASGWRRTYRPCSSPATTVASCGRPIRRSVWARCVPSSRRPTRWRSSASIAISSASPRSRDGSLPRSPIRRRCPRRTLEQSRPATPICTSRAG